MLDTPRHLRAAPLPELLPAAVVRHSSRHLIPVAGAQRLPPAAYSVPHGAAQFLGVYSIPTASLTGHRAQPY